MKKAQYKKKKTYKKDKNNKLILSLILIFLLLSTFCFFNILKNSTSNLINYFSTPAYFLKEKIEIFKNNDFLIQENKKLIKENTKLKYEILEKEQLKSQVEELKKQLDLKNIYPDYEIINSTVISRNKSYFFNELTIDKGSKDNIKEDMAVVTINGLIGRIIKVYENTSIVKMITNNDSNNKISVGVESKNGVLNGVITNYDPYKNYIEVTGLTTYDLVEVGNIVKTTGLGIFPKEIEIGVIKEIKEDNYNISKILYVTPNQDMNNIYYVSVLGNKIND